MTTKHGQLPKKIHKIGILEYKGPIINSYWLQNKCFNIYLHRIMKEILSRKYQF